MTRMLRLYAAGLRINMALHLQYRVSAFIWSIGGMMQPVSTSSFGLQSLAPKAER